MSSRSQSQYFRQPTPYPLAVKTPVEAGPNAPAAHVLGVLWRSPLMWIDYPTHWNLLWTQGMAERNPNDTDSPELKLGDPTGVLVRPVRVVWKTDNPNPVYWKPLRALIRDPLYPLGYHYAVNRNYFYSIQHGTNRPDFADIKVFAGMPRAWIDTPTYIKEERYRNGSDRLADDFRLGMPAPSILAENEAHAEARMPYYLTKMYNDGGTPRRGLGADAELAIGLPTFTPKAARRLFTSEIFSEAEAMSLKLYPQTKVPDVTVMAGDETVGFYDLKEAIAYLNANPCKTVWVYTMDAPGYPKGGRTDENSVLLILGHPNADWGYTPLSALYIPQHHEGGIGAKAATPGGAWSALMQTMQAQAPSDHPVGRVYHDVDKHVDNVNKLVGPLRAAVHQQWPDLDPIENVRSVSEHAIGGLRAASAGLNIARATAYADQTGNSAVVTSAADSDDVWSVLVAPPPGWVKRDPPKQWPRAGGRTNAYLPWFGKPTNGQ
ncbi:hypothetical protein [Ralstonia edaphi]|uniref:hypothetical protein n=1 Tax=Ralstonia edaphi TaxID=3058599 RepID=UPI00292DA1CE|nr:hypothetical protein [Ralstonia sp. LMG 6871]